jgi:serine-type D-Ala-D-Ala carboxypeptidase (penicillin-binding protein 5/6)
MIAVVMGAPSSTTRFDEAKRLLAMGFNSYRRVVLLRKDASVGPEIKVSGSTLRRIRAVAQEDIAVVVKKGIEKQLVTDVQVPKDLSAPAHRGQVVVLLMAVGHGLGPPWMRRTVATRRFG